MSNNVVTFDASQMCEKLNDSNNNEEMDENEKNLNNDTNKIEMWHCW